MFDLNKYFNDNYDTIMECKEKNIPFEWDEEAVVAVYKLAKDCASKLKIPYDKYDDFVQDCATHFFTYVIYKYNPSKNISISTYAYTAFNNVYGMQGRKKRNKSYQETVSLNKTFCAGKADDEIEYVDTIADCEMPQLDKYAQDEFYAFLKEKLDEDETLYKFFVEEKSQRKIAGELGISQAQVSRRIRDKLKMIKNEWEGKSSIKMNSRK